MIQSSTIIFVCEHGAAKSILASVYFNKLAKEKGLGITAMARGTKPDEELSPKTIEGLKQDGLQVTESIPQRLTQEEVSYASKIITFCELPEEYSQFSEIETWNNVPPVSENYQTARDAILKNVHQLLNSLSK